MKKGDIIFSVIGMGLSLWLILESQKFAYTSKFGIGPAFFPFWLGIILARILPVSFHHQLQGEIQCGRT